MYLRLKTEYLRNLYPHRQLQDQHRQDQNVSVCLLRVNSTERLSNSSSYPCGNIMRRKEENSLSRMT
ncbi:hypothetical protein VTN02DRAFT_1187 [Thermoascus thermophilus]